MAVNNLTNRFSPDLYNLNGASSANNTAHGAPSLPPRPPAQGAGQPQAYAPPPQARRGSAHFMSLQQRQAQPRPPSRPATMPPNMALMQSAMMGHYGPPQNAYSRPTTPGTPGTTFSYAGSSGTAATTPAATPTPVRYGSVTGAPLSASPAPMAATPRPSTPLRPASPMGDEALLRPSALRPVSPLGSESERMPVFARPPTTATPAQGNAAYDHLMYPRPAPQAISVASFLDKYNVPDNGSVRDDGNTLARFPQYQAPSPYQQRPYASHANAASGAPAGRPSVRDAVMSQLPAEKMHFTGHIVAPGGYTGMLTLSISPREIGDLMLRFPDIKSTQGLVNKFIEEGKWNYSGEGGIVKNYTQPHAGYTLDLNHCLDVKHQLQDDINSVFRKIQRASAPPVSAYPQQTASPTGYPAYHQPSVPMQNGRYSTVMPGHASPPSYGSPATPPHAYGQVQARPASQGRPASAPPVYGQVQGRPASPGRPTSAPPQTAAGQQPARPAGNAVGQNPGTHGKSVMARLNARLDRMGTYMTTGSAPRPAPTMVHTARSAPFMWQGVGVQVSVKISEAVVDKYLDAVGDAYSDVHFMQHLQRSGQLRMDILKNGTDTPAGVSGGFEWNAITIPPNVAALLYARAANRAT